MRAKAPQIFLYSGSHAIKKDQKRLFIKQKTAHLLV